MSSTLTSNIICSSWKARLASMYNKAKQAATPSSSPHPAGTFWASSLPHLESHLAPSSACSRAPPGGTIVEFSVPESSTASLLTVSEFSALLTFVSPGNKDTAVALWDMQSGSVSYHKSEAEAAPVQYCGERHHRLLLKSKSTTDSAAIMNFDS